MNTSHDLASGLRQLADKLESSPAFTLPISGARNSGLKLFYVTQEKDSFLQAARVLGGTKKPDDTFYGLTSSVGVLSVQVETMRSSVCRLVKPEQVIPAEYACEPLLSQAEEAELEVKS